MPKNLGAGQCFSTRCSRDDVDRGNGVRSLCDREGVARRLRQTGFSLVELMVAITIGSIIILAISVLFSQITKGYRTTDNSSRAMENGNFALRLVGEDLRMTGFVGMSKDPSTILSVKSYSIGNNCSADSNWPFLLGSNIESVDPATLSCVSAFVSGNPAIVVRHATGMETPPASLAGNNGFFVQTGVSGGGVVFRGTDYASDVKGAGRQAVVCGDDLCATKEDAPIFGYAVSAYYVRPCSRVSGAVCPDNDEGPTLVRVQLDNAAAPSFVETPIATGVERFAVAFFGENGAPAAPGAAIIARISMLVRTGREANHDDSPSSYTMVDGTTFNCGATGAPLCRFRRFVYDDTVVLKNFDYRR